MLKFFGLYSNYHICILIVIVLYSLTNFSACNEKNDKSDNDKSGNEELSAIPQHKALGISFTDIDLDRYKISGTITITRASDESDITHYVLYHGDSLIVQISKTEKEISYFLKDDTPLYDGVIYVFTSNASGEMKEGISAQITDTVGLSPLHHAQSLSFTDTDQKRGTISGKVDIEAAIDESDITHYLLYWGSTESASLKNKPQLCTIEKNNCDNYSCFIENGTLVPNGAKYFIVVTKNSFGENVSGTSIEINDIGEPDQMASSVSFYDQDEDHGKIGGEVRISCAPDEKNITHYSLYWGTSSSGKDLHIVDIEKTGKDSLIYIIPNGTPLVYDYINVFTKNQYGEMSTSVYRIINDTKGQVPVHKAVGISFNDTDTTYEEIGGNVTITRASNENDITHYAVYTSSDQDKESFGKLIGRIPKEENLICVIPANTKLDWSDDYIIVLTENKYGSMKQGVGIKIKDIYVPRENASVSFSDADFDSGEIGGTIYLKRPQDESNITHYVLYWGEKANHRGTFIAEIPKTDRYLLTSIPLHTLFDSKKEYINVYSKNQYGEKDSSNECWIFDRGNIRNWAYDIMKESLGTNITYTADLGDNATDVYFVFTNTDTSITPAAAAPRVDNAMISAPAQNSYSSAMGNRLQNIMHIPGSWQGSQHARAGRGSESADRFNKDISRFLHEKTRAALSKKYMTRGPLFSSLSDVGSQTYFKTTFSEKNGVVTPVRKRATCRKQFTVQTKFGDKTLEIWVANESWTGSGAKTYEVDQNMVDQLALCFLKEGDDNDIYDWTTKIFGEEWGRHNYPRDLIPESDTITILIHDIDDDNATDWGILGLFDSKDNLNWVKEFPVSNERTMFYIDSLFLASPEGPSWEITDFAPSQAVMTLAHELQHMIHFYQKSVLINNGVNSDTWINEMCSLMVEDFLSNKLGIDGPRGVAFNDPGPGTFPINKGALLGYVNFIDSPLCAWYEDPDLVSLGYSMSYSFGAYLARNFGGSSFFRSIIKDFQTDYKVFHWGIYEFADLLQSWGVASLLSDKNDILLKYLDIRYNNGPAWFTDTLGFNVGSINMYNYDQGLKIYTKADLGSGGDLYGTSNRFYKAGAALTGEQSWTVQLDEKGKCRLSIVFVESE